VATESLRRITEWGLEERRAQLSAQVDAVRSRWSGRRRAR
jgi:hypothetical protein